MYVRGSVKLDYIVFLIILNTQLFLAPYYCIVTVEQLYRIDFSGFKGLSNSLRFPRARHDTYTNDPLNAHLLTDNEAICSSWIVRTARKITLLHG